MQQKKYWIGVNLLDSKTPERVKEIEINIIINLKNDTSFSIT